jgi:hypothetical protein
MMIDHETVDIKTESLRDPRSKKHRAWKKMYRRWLMKNPHEYDVYGFDKTSGTPIFGDGATWSRPHNEGCDCLICTGLPQLVRRLKVRRERHVMRTNLRGLRGRIDARAQS